MSVASKGIFSAICTAEYRTHAFDTNMRAELKLGTGQKRGAAPPNDATNASVAALLEVVLSQR
jgi:hypothetical protein